MPRTLARVIAALRRLYRRHWDAGLQESKRQGWDEGEEPWRKGAAGPIVVRPSSDGYGGWEAVDLRMAPPEAFAWGPKDAMDAMAFKLNQMPAGLAVEETRRLTP